MNKAVYLVVGLAIQIILCLAQEGSPQGPVKNAIDELDKASIKGKQKLVDIGQGVEVKIENIVNPPPHISGQSGITKSAARGVGRLLRDVTIETGKFLGTVGKGLAKLGLGTAKSLKNRAAESGNRILNGRLPVEGSGNLGEVARLNQIQSEIETQINKAENIIDNAAKLPTELNKTEATSSA